MNMLKEFRDFAMRGNVIDLAVGVVIGGAFGKIVSSLVADVVTPVLGLLIANARFVDLAVTLKPALGDQPAVLLNYGKFLQNVFDFILIAFAIFLLVRAINHFRRKQAASPVPAAPPAPSSEEKLLMEIRDLLREQREGVK